MINGATLKIKRLQKVGDLLAAVVLGACGGGEQVQHGVARHVFLIVMGALATEFPSGAEGPICGKFLRAASGGALWVQFKEVVS
jgi:hypothetical protein